MLNRSPSELLTPVDELIHADLFAERDGRLMFGHDLTLEAVRQLRGDAANQLNDPQVALVSASRTGTILRRP